MLQNASLETSLSNISNQPSARSPKVLFVLPAFYRNGAVTFSINIAEQLSLKNMEVEIFAVQQRSVHPQLPHKPIKISTAIRENSSTLKSLPTLLSKLMRSVSRSDVVILTWENGLLLPSLVAFFFRKPVVAIVQNNLKRSQADYGKKKGTQMIRRWAYARAKSIVCTSQDLISTIELEVKRSKIVAISNGINIAQVRALAQQPSAPWPYVNDDIPFIVGIGRLANQKGFDLLIEAHAKVRRQGIQHRLVLVGEGEAHRALLELARDWNVADSVAFLGFVANPYPILSQASLFCLSSRYEGFGLVVAEAAALGVPTIATDCVAGPREILADGQYGDLVETYSAAALSEAIVNHFQKPKRLLAKSRASMAQIERLSLKTCGQKYSRLIHRCIQEGT